MADGRLEAAISHRATRFSAAGVYPVDFDRITAALSSWDEWCRGWSQAAAEHAQLGYQALEQGRTRSARAHLAQAAVYYHFAKFLFVQDMVQRRAAHELAVGCLTTALPYLDPPGTRLEIPFEDAVLAAVLSRPAGPGPHPAVVLIPGLDGPGQGEAEYQLPIRPDWEVPGAVILDALAAQPGIDPSRMGVWGASLGGYCAPRLASGDRRVRACISLCGPFGLGELWVQLPQLTRDAFTARSGGGGEQDAIRRAGSSPWPAERMG